jgi:SM-20-related protein
MLNDRDMLVIVERIAESGWCVVPDFLTPEVVADLRALCRARLAEGRFHAAGVGAGVARLMNEVRGDAILWVEADDPEPSARLYLKATEALRQAVNRELFMGLAELEVHFAAYPAGAFYKKHLDRFRDDDRRALTAIVYLNEDWDESDGGLLRFWPDASGVGEPVEIIPRGGVLVTFLSDRFWHEVLPAQRQRLALTGWFKRH